MLDSVNEPFDRRQWIDAVIERPEFQLETSTWKFMLDALRRESSPTVKRLVVDCISRIVGYNNNISHLKYLGRKEENVALIKATSLPGLPCDVGVRISGDKLTLCYLGGSVVMCDLDFASSISSEHDGEAVLIARKVVFYVILKVAKLFPDVVDATSAVPVDTPKGMHIYFKSQRTRASPARLFAFLRLTCDPQYIWAYGMDPTRGFCDKVLQEMSTDNIIPLTHSGLEITNGDRTHAKLAARPTHANIEIHDRMNWFWPLLRLRTRLAKYAMKVEEADEVFVVLRMLEDNNVQRIPDEMISLTDRLNNNIRTLFPIICNHVRHTNISRKQIGDNVKTLLYQFQEPTLSFTVDDTHNESTALYREHLVNIMLAKRNPFSDPEEDPSSERNRRNRQETIDRFFIYKDNKNWALQRLAVQASDAIKHFTESVIVNCPYQRPDEVFADFDNVNAMFSSNGNVPLSNDVFEHIMNFTRQRDYEFDLTSDD